MKIEKSPLKKDELAMCRLTGGRIGAVAAIVVFFGCYVYGIVKFGILLGVGVGWLPAALIAWLAARLFAPVSTALLCRLVAESRYFSSLVHASRLPR